MRAARAYSGVPATPQIVLPDCPSLVAGHGRAAIVTADGEMFFGDAAEMLSTLHSMPPPMLVHAPATWRRLGVAARPCLDLLDLFAFACPAQSAAPTPRGLCLALGLDRPGAGPEAAASILPDIAAALLGRIRANIGLGRAHAASDPAALAARMGLAGWPWAPVVLAALGQPEALPGPDTLRAWKRLPMWEDAAAAPPPSAHPVSEAEARARLSSILGPDAEQRPGQADYAAAAAAAFAPREDRGDPRVVLAEAGTGIGKTLGYIAPREPVGGAQRRSGLGQHLHASPATTGRRGTGPPVPQPGRAAASRGGAQGARELPVPAQSRQRAGDGGRVQSGQQVAIDRPARASVPLVARDRGWRPARRRLARLVRRTVRRAVAGGLGRPARRVPLWSVASISGAASSSTPSAARAPPTSSSRTMRW